MAQSLIIDSELHMQNVEVIFMHYNRSLAKEFVEVQVAMLMHLLLTYAQAMLNTEALVLVYSL